MPNLKSIEAAVAMMDRWCADENKLREKALESFLLIELFKGVLGFKEIDTQGSNRVGISDIVLKPFQRRSSWVIVEIKAPDVSMPAAQIQSRKTDEAIQQAGRYLAEECAARGIGTKHPTRGIITNGHVWIFIRIRPKTKTARYEWIADVLLRLEKSDIKNNRRKVMTRVLQRCEPRTIHHFFDLLEALYDLGKKRMSEILPKHSADKAIDLIKTEVEATQNLDRARLANADIDVIKFLANKDLFKEFMSNEYRSITFHCKPKKSTKVAKAKK